MNWLLDYFRGTKVELRHVNWPTRKDTINFTIIVIVVSFLAAAYLGVFDFIFSLALEQILKV